MLFNVQLKELVKSKMNVSLPVCQYDFEISTVHPHSIQANLVYGQAVLLLNITGGAVAWWLTPQTPDPEVGGSSPTGVAVLCP